MVDLNLSCGRTLQIRVHCTALGHPIVGDSVYCPRKSLTKLINRNSTLPPAVIDRLKKLSRQMLHAWRLGIVHPRSGERMTFESPMPQDMEELIDKLRGIG